MIHFHDDQVGETLNQFVKQWNTFSAKKVGTQAEDLQVRHVHQEREDVHKMHVTDVATANVEMIQVPVGRQQTIEIAVDSETSAEIEVSKVGEACQGF